MIEMDYFNCEKLTEINNKLDELKAITCNKMIEKGKEKNNERD